MAYEVGYRRPPKKNRFKKGQSGNPKGRPKGSSNFLTLLEQELEKSITITEDGKKKKISRKQAMVKRMVAGALQGDQKALYTLVELMRRTGHFEETDIDDLLPDDYESILDSYIEKRQKTDAKKTRKTKKKEDRS